MENESHKKLLQSYSTRDESETPAYLETPEQKAERINEAKRKAKLDWTIMVYLAGDNNLAEEMVYALKSMFSVGSTDEYRVFAYYDAGLDPVSFAIPTRTERLQELRGLGQGSSPRSLTAQSLKVEDVKELLQAGPVTENHELLKLKERVLSKMALRHYRRPDSGSREIPPVQSTLEEFIKDCVLDAPARYYMLVLSGHGSGSVGDFLAGKKRFTGLSIPDLSATLSNVAEYFRLRDANDLYERINILGLDSCQMSTAEMAYAVRRHVDYLVGAEGFEANTGWPYDQLLARLNERIHEQRDLDTAAEFASKLASRAFNSGETKESALNTARDGTLKAARERRSLTADEERIVTKVAAEAAAAALELSSPVKRREKIFDPRQIAKGIVKEYTKFYSSDYTLADVSTDLSALYLRKIGDLVQLLGRRNGLADHLTKAMRLAPDGRPQYQEIYDAVILAHWEVQGYKDEQNVDLWDFCECLRRRCERAAGSELGAKIAAICEQVRKTIDRTEPGHDQDPEIKDDLVVLSGYCGPAFQHSHGVSVYFPWTRWTDAAGTEDLDHYQTMEFALDSRWDQFLSAYTKATQRRLRRKVDPVHSSSLNRREWLYTGRPQAMRTGTLKNQNGRCEVRDAVWTSEAKPLILGGKELSLKKGKVAVRDGILSITDGRVTVSEGLVAVRDGESKLFEGSASDQHLEMHDGVWAVRDGKLELKDGVWTVRDGVWTVRDSQLTVRDGVWTVRDGVWTVRDGMWTVRDGVWTVRDGQLAVRDGVWTVRDGVWTVRDGVWTVRDADTVRDGVWTVRDGVWTVRDGVWTVRDGEGTVRENSISTRGGLPMGPIKISSMKNPPVFWSDCDLIQPMPPRNTEP